MTHKLPIYYYDDNEKACEFKMTDCTFKVGSMGDEFIIVEDFYGISTAIKVGDQYFFHNTEGPALMIPNHNEAHFFVQGVLMTIDEMPISDEYKLILTIKYGHPFDNDRTYRYL